MARGENRIHEVELGSAPIERFRPLVSTQMWPELEGGLAGLKRRLDGHVLWNVNSTACGGGVAEMLASLIPYDRGAGIDERWAVVEGSPDFFNATKKIHTLLHGVEPDGGPLTAGERRVYEEATARNSEGLARLIRPGDVAILHDPQTAGLVPSLRARGVKVVWRSHIGVDEPNDLARTVWDFLRPFVSEASACVFSRAAYAWDGLDEARVRIITPCIDPFSTKNQDIPDESVTAILRASGTLQGVDGEATFTRHDGTAARVTRSAQVGDGPVAADARIVLQVSRWDRLKEPVGVMDFSSASSRRGRTHASCSRALPQPPSSTIPSNPRSSRTWGAVTRRCRLRPATGSSSRKFRCRTRRRTPPSSTPCSGARMWSSRKASPRDSASQFPRRCGSAGRSSPAASAASPTRSSRAKAGSWSTTRATCAAFGDAVVGLLQDEPPARWLGVEARHRVARKFISPCHLIEQARLVVDLVS